MQKIDQVLLNALVKIASVGQVAYVLFKVQSMRIQKRLCVFMTSFYTATHCCYYYLYSCRTKDYSYGSPAAAVRIISSLKFQTIHMNAAWTMTSTNTKIRMRTCTPGKHWRRESPRMNSDTRMHNAANNHVPTEGESFCKQ